MKRFRGGARNRQHEIQSLDRAAVDTGKVRPTEHKRLAPLVDLEAEISDPGKPVIPAIAHHRLVGFGEPYLIAAVLRERESSRSEEHKSEIQSLMPISYAAICFK